MNRNDMMKRILLVDGMALLFRGYYATAYSRNFMKREDGVATNGVYQFLKYFLSGVQTFSPTHVICCWDMGSKTFRTDVFNQYKANRGAPPEELVPQFDLVKETVDLFDIPNIGIHNFEADDIIGSLVSRFHQEHEIIIQTGDYDMLQLVKKNVDVAIMRKGIGNYEVFNQDNFHEKRGITPEQIIEFKGFTGDSADNYPGIKGIGEKTALKLLQTYGSMDQIIAAKHELTKGIQTKITEHIDMFHLCKQLAEIKCDVPVECVLEDAEVRFNIPTIETGLQGLGIRLQHIDALL